MTDIPIIFSAPMVRALLEGRKTMTRRLARTERKIPGPGTLGGEPDRIEGPSPWQRVKIGDRLWVRETWRASYGWDWYSEKLGRTPRPSDITPGNIIEYLADGEHELGGKNWPSIFMPRWASRLTLIVTGVKIERLQDISDNDMLAEGIIPYKSGNMPMFGIPVPHAFEHPGLTLRETFLNLWCTLHGPNAWNQNPFVVAISFRVIKANIDLAAEVERS